MLQVLGLNCQADEGPTIFFTDDTTKTFVEGLVPERHRPASFVERQMFN